MRRGERVADPATQIVGDDVDAGGPAQPRRADEGVDLGGDGVEVVAGRWLVAVAEPARVEDHDAPPARGEQRRDLAPGVAVLGQPGSSSTGSPLPISA